MQNLSKILKEFSIHCRRDTHKMLYETKVCCQVWWNALVRKTFMWCKTTHLQNWTDALKYFIWSLLEGFLTRVFIENLKTANVFLRTKWTIDSFLISAFDEYFDSEPCKWLRVCNLWMLYFSLTTADDTIILEEQEVSSGTINLSYPCKLPRFSKVVGQALQTGKIYQEWDQFVREAAIFYLPDIPVSDGLARIAYHNIGRSVYDKYPCIASAGQNAWVSTCTLRFPFRCTSKFVRLHMNFCKLATAIWHLL